MKILIAVADYPSKEKIAMMYVHTRNLYYKKYGIDIEVLNFSAKISYEYEGIKVINLNDFKLNKERYDLLLCHAPNIRNHFFFLKKYNKFFKKIIFFFHGHEVLKINKVYSKPYFYIKSNKVKVLFQDIYDEIKLFIWRNYFPRIIEKSHFIFVSKWMLDEFKKWIKINEKLLKDKVSITYNGIGDVFKNQAYNVKKLKKYDFITIRNNLDGSKYCIDIVCELAKKNPEYRFLVIGKGNFFKYYQKPRNLEWKSIYCDHKKIIELLNSAKCALMPTRTDAQGLMACEMASFGIPLITSDISVCHEIFDEFKNVKFINNINPNDKFKKIFLELIEQDSKVKNPKYFSNNTIDNEIKIFNSILKGEKI